MVKVSSNPNKKKEQTAPAITPPPAITQTTQTTTPPEAPPKLGSALNPAGQTYRVGDTYLTYDQFQAAAPLIANNSSPSSAADPRVKLAVGQQNETAKRISEQKMLAYETALARVKSQVYAPTTPQLEQQTLNEQVAANQQMSPDPLLNQDEGALNTAMNIGSGLAGAGGGAIIGAKVGTAAAPILGPLAPAAPIIGAVGGAVVGGGFGIGAKITYDETQKVKNANKLYVKTAPAFGDIITESNKNPTYVLSGQADKDWRIALDNIEWSRQHLKTENTGWRKGFSKGFEEMVALNTFIDQDLPRLQRQFQAAKDIPNPSIIVDSRVLFDVGEK